MFSLKANIGVSQCAAVQYVEEIEMGITDRFMCLLVDSGCIKKQIGPTETAYAQGPDFHATPLTYQF